MSKAVRIQLADLYLKRADCYMKMAVRFNKQRYAKLATENTFFILNEKSMMADVITEKILHDQVKLLDTKASQFIEDRVQTQSTAQRETTNVSLKNKNCIFIDSVVFLSKFMFYSNKILIIAVS